MIYFLIIIGGLAFGWRAAFFTLVAFMAVDVLVNVILPSFDGHRNRRRNARLRKARERERAARLAERHEAFKPLSGKRTEIT